jgi:hypothetical protein
VYDMFDKEPALDTGLTVIHGPAHVGRRTEDPALANSDLEPAALSAEWADRPSCILGQTIISDGPFSQGTGRADIDAGTAKAATGFDEPAIEGGAYDGL